MRCFLKWLRILVATIVIALAVLINVVRFATPFLNAHVNFFEKWASRALHQPVHIGHIATGWYGFDPAFTFQDLVITDAEKNQPAYRISRLSIGIDVWHSLLHWELQSVQARIKAQGICIVWPAWFEQPLVFNKINAIVQWQKNNSAWQLTMPTLLLMNQDMHWQGHLSLTKPIDGSLIIDTDLQFALNQAASLPRYLPKQGCKPGLCAWLRHAFLSGAIQAGHLTLQGALNQFPFDQGSGKFDLSATLANLDLRYSPHWPVLQGITGTLTAHQNDLQIQVKTAKTVGNPFDQIVADITHLATTPVLTVNAHAKTNLADGMAFLHQSPLEAAKEMAGLVAHGPLDFNFQLVIPLDHQAGNIVSDGQIAVHHGELQLPHWGLTLSGVKGLFTFHNHDLTASHVHAHVYGMPLTADVATVLTPAHESMLQLSINGMLNTTALQQQYHSSWLHYFQGQTPYHALLQLHGVDSATLNQLTLVSDLQGLQSTLPAPYDKPTTTLRSLAMTMDLSQKRPVQLTMHYGNDLSAAMTLAKKATRWQFNSGEIHLGLGQAHFQTKPGLLVTMKLNQLAGHLFIPPDQRQVWQGHLTRLYLLSHHTSFATSTSPAPPSIDPRHLPPLHLSIDDFRYDKKILGSVILHTSAVPTGMRIDTLMLLSPLVSIQAVGSWQILHQEPITTLDGQLLSTDLGTVLKNWHITHVLEGGKGSANFSLGWSGSPQQFSAANLNGDVKFDFRHGRVTHLSHDAESEVGFGRLLNLFSLQSIPLLPLNLVHLTQKGFPFSLFSGDFHLVNGDATTQQMTLVGPVAWVAVNGHVGFATKKYDLNLEVTPNVTSSLPLIVGLAGGPIAGAITWIADKILAHQVGKVAKVNYRITGTWDKPSIVKLPAPAQTTVKRTS